MVNLFDYMEEIAILIAEAIITATESEAVTSAVGAGVEALAAGGSVGDAIGAGAGTVINSVTDAAVNSAASLGEGFVTRTAGAIESLGGPGAEFIGNVTQLTKADLGLNLLEAGGALGATTAGVVKTMSQVAGKGSGGSAKVPEPTVTTYDPGSAPKPKPIVYDPAKPGGFDPGATNVGNTYWNEFGGVRYRSTKADYVRQVSLEKQIKKLAKELAVALKPHKKKKKKTKKKKKIHPSG